MACAPSPTTITDIHPLIMQTHILPRLDGQSLSSAAATSSYLRTITADDILLSDICRSTWPSITHPRIHQLISTFPAGYRSFFQDSFQPPITAVTKLNCHRSSTNHSWPSELISAVDIRCRDDIIYSKVKVTNTNTEFLSSTLKIVLKNDSGDTGIPISIELNLDELINDDDATMSHLKESITLNWILIHPSQKRAINLSSIKPVLAWITNTDINLRYAVVLPGCGSHETVECRIEVTMGVCKGGVALHVREVKLHIQDVFCNNLTGKDLLVITNMAFTEKYNIRRSAGEGVAGSDQTKCVKNGRNHQMMSGLLGHDIVILILCYCAFAFCMYL